MVFKPQEMKHVDDDYVEDDRVDLDGISDHERYLKDAADTFKLNEPMAKLYHLGDGPPMPLEQRSKGSAAGHQSEKLVRTMAPSEARQKSLATEPEIGEPTHDKRGRSRTEDADRKDKKAKKDKK